jgi:hypothetical protein
MNTLALNIKHHITGWNAGWLLLLATIPFFAHAAVHEEVAIGDQSVTPEHTRIVAGDIDKIMQRLNHAQLNIEENQPAEAQKDLKPIYQDLGKIRKYGLGDISENIIVTHGPQLTNHGSIDTADAYYRPDMVDMQLLRRAEHDLKQGKSERASDDLSAVRFPFVEANAEFLPSETSSEVDFALMNLKQGNFHAAADDIQDIRVNANAYASLFNTERASQ